MMRPIAGRDHEAGRRAVDGLVVRTGRKDDLPELVRIYNHYVTHSIITFDTQPVTVESRLQWFERFSDTGPHQLFRRGHLRRVRHEERRLHQLGLDAIAPAPFGLTLEGYYRSCGGAAFDLRACRTRRPQRSASHPG